MADISPISQQLEEFSPAYAAYIRRDTIPPRAGLVRVEGVKFPQIMIGEIFCRYPLDQGKRVCGAKVGRSYNALPDHMSQEHGVDPKSWPKPPPYLLTEQRLLAFDRQCQMFMEGEEYPGSSGASVVAHIQDDTRSDRPRVVSPVEHVKLPLGPLATGVEVANQYGKDVESRSENQQEEYWQESGQAEHPEWLQDSMRKLG